MYFQELMIQKLLPLNAKLYYDMEDGRRSPIWRTEVTKRRVWRC